MGKVAALMKVFPEDMDKFEGIKKAIQEKIKPARIDEEPVAFGFKALKVTIIRDDKEGMGDVEEQVRAIPGVSQAEITDVGLISQLLLYLFNSFLYPPPVRAFPIDFLAGLAQPKRGISLEDSSRNILVPPHSLFPDNLELAIALRAKRFCREINRELEFTQDKRDLGLYIDISRN